MPRKPAAAAARKPTPAGSRKKRSRGRPRKAQRAVGRETIVTAARKLLESMLPHQVTMVLIARKAGVDPALVRYYFADRETLLLAVIEDMLASRTAALPPEDAPADEQLSTYMADVFGFASRVRSMQRLMIDECAEAQSPAVRARVRALNSAAVQYYARLLRVEDDPGSPEPLFLHAAIIGLCDFFLAAQAMILPLAPKHLSAAQLAERYGAFVRTLVLDGVRKRLTPATVRRRAI